MKPYIFTDFDLFKLEESEELQFIFVTTLNLSPKPDLLLLTSEELLSKELLVTTKT